MQPEDRIRKFPLDRGRRAHPHAKLNRKHIGIGSTVTVIPCKAPDKCAHRVLIGQVGRVIRTESDHAMVQFSSGYLKWLPTFHLHKEV